MRRLDLGEINQRLITAAKDCPQGLSALFRFMATDSTLRFCICRNIGCYFSQALPAQLPIKEMNRIIRSFKERRKRHFTIFNLEKRKEELRAMACSAEPILFHSPSTSQAFSRICDET